jgi:glycopeptide antibiotics resistance protein
MNNKEIKRLNILSIILFCIYILLLIWIVLFKCNIYLSITNGYFEFKTLTLKERFEYYLIPFIDYFNNDSTQTFIKLKDGILNVFVFIPLGLYLSFFIKKNKFIKVIIYSFLISLLFEIIQLFSLLGSFQTEDLILNIFSGLLGYIIYKIIYKEKNIKVLNILSLICIIILTPILIYGVINTINMIDVYIDVITRSL